MRVLIVDDHPVFGKALNDLVLSQRPDTQVHHAVSAGEMLLALKQGQGFNIVFLDLFLPDAVGLVALKTLRRHSPLMPVVVISGDDSLEVVEGAYAFSVLGYISKRMPFEAMSSAVGNYLEISFKTPLVQPSQPTTNADSSPSQPELASIYDLTPREYEVASQMGKGRSNKNIADILSIADGTVKQHANRIFRKMGVGTRSEAIAIIAKLGSRQD